MRTALMTAAIAALVTIPACERATPERPDAQEAPLEPIVQATHVADAHCLQGLDRNVECPPPDAAYVSYLSTDPLECCGVQVSCKQGWTNVPEACGCGCMRASHGTSARFKR